MTSNEKNESDEIVIKRGRVPIMQDFRFNDKLMPKDIDMIVEVYHENNKNEQLYNQQLKPLFSKIYNFYLERKVANKRRKPYRKFVHSFILDEKDFIKLLKGFLDSFVAKNEVSFYHYLKHEIDVIFNCIDPKRYFYNREEDAMKLYLKLKDVDKLRADYIYKKFLDYPFHKLIENLINTYKLTSDRVCFKDLQSDTISFLHDKFDKFDPEKGRAYSYFGTIAKHRLQAIRIDENKDKNRNYSYENAYNDLGDDERYSYTEKIYETNILVDLYKEIPRLITDYIKGRCRR